MTCRPSRCHRCHGRLNFSQGRIFFGWLARMSHFAGDAISRIASWSSSVPPPDAFGPLCVRCPPGFPDESGVASVPMWPALAGQRGDVCRPLILGGTSAGWPGLSEDAAGPSFRNLQHGPDQIVAGTVAVGAQWRARSALKRPAGPVPGGAHPARRSRGRSHRGSLFRQGAPAGWPMPRLPPREPSGALMTRPMDWPNLFGACSSPWSSRSAAPARWPGTSREKRVLGGLAVWRVPRAGAGGRCREAGSAAGEMARGAEPSALRESRAVQPARELGGRP